MTFKHQMVYSNFMIQFASYKLFIAILIAVLLYISQSVECIYAADCEILETQMYEREQDSIVTDWINSVPYKRYQTETYPCAHIKIRNNFWQGISSEDITITATFTDKSTVQKKFGCEKKRLEFNDEYSCDICFESKYPIAALECSLSPK
jgi:hypothetical protein